VNSNGIWGVGCTPCSQISQFTPFATFAIRSPSQLQLQHFLRHAELESHQRAVLRFNDNMAKVCSLSFEAPSVAQFMSLKQALRTRRSLQFHGGKACFRMKNRKMLYCLAEGIRTLDRRFLQTATSISLAQDVSARAHTLLARFTATNDNLDTRHGVLGHLRLKQTGHKALLKGTAQIILRASTDLHNPPRRADLRPFGTNVDVLDSGLAMHIRKSIVVWNTDSGSDELLAGAEARIASAHVRPLLPNIIFVNRDRCHASRRAVSRPWEADPLGKCLLKILKGSNSVMALIQHSVSIGEWYTEYQLAMPRRIITIQKDLGLARHRFESASVPFAKLCLTWHAINMTAIRVMMERGSGPKDKGFGAIEHLRFFTGMDGVERMVFMGMLCDAALEGLSFIRFNDVETSDAALLSTQAATYLKTLKVLFVDGKALKIAKRLQPFDMELFGHTVHVPSALLTPIEVFKAMRTYHMRAAPVPVAADMFVVADVVNPGLTQAWCAALSGAWIMSPVFFTTGGNQGCAIAFQRPTAVTKYIWVSSAFANQYGVLDEALSYFMRQRGSAFKRVCYEDLLVKLRQRSNAAKCIGLVTRRCIRDQPALARLPYICDAWGFIKKIRVLDPESSRLGVCSR